MALSFLWFLSIRTAGTTELTRNMEEKQGCLLADIEQIQSWLRKISEETQQILPLTKSTASRAASELLQILPAFAWLVFTFTDATCLSPSPPMLEPTSHANSQLRLLELQTWNMPANIHHYASPSRYTLAHNWPDVCHQTLLFYFIVHTQERVYSYRGAHR